MSWKRLLFAFLAFVLAAGLYYVDRQQAVKEVYESVNESSLAPGTNASEVTEIILRNRFGEVHLRREEKGWRMRKPMEAPADPETIEQLLVNVTGARKRNEITVSSFEEYGLENPGIVLTLRTQRGQEFELAIGLSSTYTGQVFACYPGSQKVFTVSEAIKNTLSRQPSDFMMSRLIDVDVGSLENYLTVRLKRPAKDLELRNERGQWQISLPETAPAENAVVEEWLRRLGMLRASGFLTQATDTPTSLATALEALEQPILQLELIHATKGVHKLTVGKVAAQRGLVYVARRNDEPEVLYFGHEKFEELDVDENHFRSRNLFTLRPSDVGYVVFEIGRARTDIVRNEKGEWEFVGDPTRRVDQEKVNLRLDLLLKTRIKEYVDSDPRDASVYGLMPPRMRFTVTAADKSRSEILEVGKSEPDNVTSVYARRGGDNKVFTIEMGRELIVLPDTLADPHFADFDERTASRIEIEIDGQAYDLRREGMEWKILRPGQTVYAPADLGKLKRVLETLKKLTYDKDLTASGETVIAPVERPALRFVAFGDQDTTLSLVEVGKRLPKSSFVKDARNRTYEVLNSELDLLMAQLRSLLD